MEYQEANERLKDQSRCGEVRAQLKMCLLKTDCCKIVSNLKNVQPDFKFKRKLHLLMLT